MQGSQVYITSASFWAGVQRLLETPIVGRNEGTRRLSSDEGSACGVGLPATDTRVGRLPITDQWCACATRSCGCDVGTLVHVPTASTATGVDDAALLGLRRWNFGLTVLHLAQALAILLLASNFAITVIASYAQGPPGTDLAEPTSILDVRIGVAVAVFLALAALDHLVTATVGRRRYEADLRLGLNLFRWVEYSFSATLMIVLISFYNGIVEISAVFGLVGANVAMILFGWLQELMNPPGRTSTTMLPFWFGCVAGAAPWVAITWNLVAAREDVPGFVFGIFVSLFVFFMSFAVNQWLHYRELGPWRSYAFGERGYLVLSLVAKSALAWQIFAGSLA